MSKKTKQKYYVVWRGRNTGVFSSWEECKKQVSGFEGAQFKSFSTFQDAEQAFGKSYEQIIELKGKKILHELTVDKKPILYSISVDAACKGNPGILEFQGVFTDTGTPIFKRGPYDDGTQNIGEFLAIVLALAYLKKNKLEMPVYSDSQIAIAWVRKKRLKSKIKWTEKNKKLLKAVHNAVEWLNKNDYSNIDILKWDTKLWGEIPADFGRK